MAKSLLLVLAGGGMDEDRSRWMRLSSALTVHHPVRGCAWGDTIAASAMETGRWSWGERI